MVDNGSGDGIPENSPVATLEGERATEDTRGEKKVDTKEGTTKFGLPWERETGPFDAGTGEKPTPEAAKKEA